MSDQIGRKRVIYGLALCYLIFAYPLFSLLVSGDFFSFFVVNLFFAFIASAYYGVAMAMCIEQFPTYIRYTGVGVGYVISHTIFGDITGLTIVKELIIHIPAIEFAPVFYLFFGCILVIICTFFMKEKNKTELPD